MKKTVAPHKEPKRLWHRRRKPVRLSILFGLALAIIGVGFILRSFAVTPDATTGDLNGDGKVNIQDLALQLINFGKTGSGVKGDINGDGKVNIQDLALLLVSFGKPVSPPPPPPGGGSGSYAIRNNLIYDPQGTVFWPHGVDRPTLEWSCTGLSVSNGAGGIPASDYSTMKSGWSANTVRVALNQDFWLQDCQGYQATVASNIQAIRAQGMIALLDLHWSDKGVLGSTAAQQCMADSNSVTFWQQLAAKYKGDSGVWFELYNEPHDITSDQWLNGGSACGFQTVGMQALYQAVRGAGANNIVVATGNGYGQHLEGLPLVQGANVAYATHPYANDPQSGGDPNSWSASDWDNRFGFMSKKAPLIATEFGRRSCGTSTYDQGILDYFRSHGIGYTTWAWFASDCRFPSIIKDAAGTCAEYGCAVQTDIKGLANGSLSMTPATYQP